MIFSSVLCWWAAHYICNNLVSSEVAKLFQHTISKGISKVANTVNLDMSFVILCNPLASFRKKW